MEQVLIWSENLVNTRNIEHESNMTNFTSINSKYWRAESCETYGSCSISMAIVASF